MNTENAKAKQELKAWVKKQLSRGVYDLIDAGIIEDTVVEAKPAWVLPYTLVMGRIRGRGDQDNFEWFICGECQTSHVSGSSANTPREAARHIALQWQLQIENMSNGDQQKANELQEQAESLYSLTELDELWHDPSGSI